MKSKGFSGTVTNTSLHDVIQLICIGRCTCRMRVRCRTNEGVIHFREGEIVHAENGSIEGEEAFYDILSWPMGVFSCEERFEAKATIEESWDFLLMESLRRFDVLRAS